MTDNPWTSIREQLETASEGSRAIDSMFGALLSGPPWKPDTPGYIWCPGVGSENSRAIEVRKYSTDLNAIVAAVEAEPLINCHGYDKDPIGIQAHVSRNNVSEGHFLFEGTQCTPALALCLAFAKMKETSHD